MSRGAANTITLTTPGSGSLTVPAGYEWTNVTVQCWSGGGGGAGGWNDYDGYFHRYGDGGGGGGAYAYKGYTILLAGTYHYLIGVGGAGGPSGSNGSAGGSTIWNYEAQQDINVTGGGGSENSDYSLAGAAGGLVLAGTGYQGGSGGQPGYGSGGGGGSAGLSGSGGNGGAGAAFAPYYSGSEGTGYAVGGAGAFAAYPAIGTPSPAGGGSFPGGGGGAWMVAGGSGANGEIVITYTQEAVPEPSTFALLGVGVINLAAYAWRRRRLNRLTFTMFCLLFAILLCVPANAQTFTFKTLDDPLAGKNNFYWGTQAFGISGSNIVGRYIDSSLQYHGFIYDGSTYTTLDDTSAGAGGIADSGISGSNIVGYYQQGLMWHGFLYNGSTYTTLDDPLAVPTSVGNGGTWASGISGNNIAGYYEDSSGISHGFIYNGSTYMTFDDPLGVQGTAAFGIDGKNIVGSYEDSSSNEHGFLYNGSTYTTLDDPLGVNISYAMGVSGKNIVGDYRDSSDKYHGYLYNGSTYTTLDDPLVGTNSLWGTQVCGISGNNIVGYYTDSSGEYHGFIATIVPEPSTLALLGIGAVGLLGYAARRRWQRLRLRHNDNRSCPEDHVAIAVLPFVLVAALGTKWPNSCTFCGPKAA